MEQNGKIAKNFLRCGFWTALAAVLLIGCGGGGGGPGSVPGPVPVPVPSDSFPPTVVSTDPADGVIDVAVDASLRIIFSEPMDSATVNGTTVKVQTGALEVAGTVHCAAGTVTFTPAANWSFATSYTVSISGGPSGVKDMAGNPLASDYACMFTTAVEIVGSGTVISSGTDSASGAQLAMDASGTAVAVWVQGNGIWSNRYIPATGWGAATRISAGPGQAEAPQLAMDGRGFTTAVWRQWDGAQYSVYANRYVPATGWGAATLIETGPGEAGGPQVAMDNTGRAISVWDQMEGAAQRIYANHYVPGTGWGQESPIETGSDNAYGPKVAMDSNGNAIAVWSEYDVTDFYIVHASRYVPGTGWGTETRIDTASRNNHGPQVAMDDSGTAVAVWAGWSGSGFEWRGGIWTNRYVLGTGWETPTAILTSQWGVFPSQVAMGGAGNAAVVWYAPYPVGGGSYGSIPVSDIGGSYYSPVTGWAAPSYISNSYRFWWHQAAAPHVAMDRKGNAVAVWHQEDNWTSIPLRRDIYANCYVAGTGWGTAGLVETAGGDASFPQVATDGNGNFLIVWQQWDGTRFNISAVRYQVP